MGEEAAGNRQLLIDPKIGAVGFAEAAAQLAIRHGLGHSAELELLIDHLFGLACRDQEERYVEPSKMAERRREGFKLARAMRDEATVMLASLERLHCAYNQFQDVVSFNTGLLTSIFNAELGPPEELCLPRDLEILQTGFYDGLSTQALDEAISGCLAELPNSIDPVLPCPPFLWETVDAKLREFASLPVKAKLARGPLRNAALFAAVSSCRDYWVDAECRSWTMSSLKIAAVRSESDVANLKGSCEKFVADVLSEAGVRFSLSDLSSAWDAVDKARRDAKQPSP